MLSKKRENLLPNCRGYISGKHRSYCRREKLRGNRRSDRSGCAVPIYQKYIELMAPDVKEGQIIVNVAKGIEEKTLMTMTDIISEEIRQRRLRAFGPSHAEEVGRGLPTTCVISGPKRETAEYLQGIFTSPVFRVYTTPDTLGVELGGSLKNVIALAAGTADGLGYGDNTKAL